MGWRHVIFITCLLSVGILTTRGSITDQGVDTPISTQPSLLQQVKCGASPGPLFQGQKPPFPTDTWWVGAGVLPQTSTLAGPYPYIAAALNQGVTFGLPLRRTFDGKSVHVPSQNDLAVQAAEIPNDINAHKAVAWDEMSVTIQWFSGGSTLTSYLVPGSAYMTFNYNAATVNVLARNGNFRSINGQNIANSVAITGTKFKLTLSSGPTYILYTLSNVTLTATPTTISTAGKWTGILRIAGLNGTDAAAESTLDSSSGTYATSAAISYKVTGNDAYVSYTWKVGGGDPSKLLQLAWLHHRELLQNPVYARSVQVLTLKGLQIGVLGNVWTLKYALPVISWFAPRQPDSSCINIVNQALDDQVQTIKPPVPNDFYFWGGSFSALARLALIAEELGRKEVIPKIVAALKTSFAPWVDGTATDPPAYESLWGGVVSKPGATDSNVDFGNGYYNDHHFHYGYHLFGASVIARYDAAWFAQNKRYITELARDIGNPSSQDPYFPITRHMDWFAGHSWASGIANGAGSRDEESTTEAVNGYYGLYMYALVAENCELQNLARILLATEIHSVQHYWHLYPNAVGETTYPEQVFRNFATVGNVQDQQAGPWLWWGGEKSEIAAIQLLPITPITEYVVDAEWGKAMYKYTSVEFTDPNVGDEWKSLIYMAHATWDPIAAFTESQALTSWGSGNTNLNTLWWIATRALSNTGQVCKGAVVVGPNINQGAIFSKSANAYLVVGAGDNALATSKDVKTATLFNFGDIAGGSTIQNVATGKYASSDNAGAPLVVNRQTPSAWETFTFTKVGDYFSIRAHSNSLFLGANTAGQVVNNINNPSPLTVPDVALFKLVCPNGATVCPGPSPKNYTYTPQPTITTPPITANCKAFTYEQTVLIN